MDAYREPPQIKRLLKRTYNQDMDKSIQYLLDNGWRIVHMAGAGSGNSYTREFLIYLESDTR